MQQSSLGVKVLFWKYLKRLTDYFSRVFKKNLKYLLFFSALYSLLLGRSV